MFDQQSAKRLDDKSPLHAIQVELQQGYALSPVEAQVLARRLQQIIDEQTGYTRGLGQVTYQAIAQAIALAGRRLWLRDTVACFLFPHTTINMRHARSS